MHKIGPFILELLRVLLIVMAGTPLLIGIETWLYSLAGKNIFDFTWMPATANIIIIFVLYRNVLQFGGWFKSKQNKRLGKIYSRILILVSLVLILIPLAL